MDEPVTIRPRGGILLTCFIALLVAGGVVTMLIRSDFTDLLRFLPALAFALFGTWLLFWYPSVTVAPWGVTVRNPLRTFEVSWPAIEDVETRYALTLITVRGRIQAWSAPAPSRWTAVAARSADVRSVHPDSVRDDGTIAMGDIPSSPSGGVAVLVRRTWSALRDAGHLDHGAIEGTGVRARWNARPLAIAGALLVIAVIASVP